MKKIFLACSLSFLCTHMTAQRKADYNKSFQASITPGLTTNGMHHAAYNNFFSINLTSGYSASNYLLEIGVVSNLNVNETRGLQLAGLSNFTGANAFTGMTLKEQENKVKSGFEANLSGIQLAGLTNVVLNNVFGAQIAGALNLSKGALQGFQVSGLSNIVYKYSFGVQVSALWNVSLQSMDGVQMAGLANYTHGGLYGIQVAAINLAGVIEGKNSTDKKYPSGVQAGLVNHAGKMNGFQIGLINIARRMQGTQIGLINIYRGGTATETRDGTAIGLVNAGDFGYASVYCNEIFLTNVEIATGNPKNRRIKANSRTVYVVNSLLYSKGSSFFHDNTEAQRDRWAFGNGLHKFYYTRNNTPGMGEYRFIAGGIEALHVNHTSGTVTKELSLIVRPEISAGTRLHPRLQSVYLFGSLNYNVYLSDEMHNMGPSRLTSTTIAGNVLLEMWPGFSAGVLVH